MVDWPPKRPPDIFIFLHVQYFYTCPLSVVKAWVRLFERVCHHYFATVYSYTSVSVIAC